jgi:hypothetical protein
MFEECQQPTIQTTMVPCPQSSDHGLDAVFHNPNKNKGWPAAMRKTTKSAAKLLSNSELLILFKYSKLKLKNQKLLAVDILFKAYSMVPLWQDGAFRGSFQRSNFPTC